eukprot:CAMPEP_0174272810 /NCGR_PEP_ID=MMETSP0439-20130205/52520_1 /TAXON_ID=0 /ORGANISM="Stereomyxa ramosa, Strain Chinc5" /LENGTH=797 /DNA_ID=CAMNT_0015363599 /DNA_START=453 /DNA_END=2846 /DNA_ORIENTATION=-
MERQWMNLGSPMKDIVCMLARQVGKTEEDLYLILHNLNKNWITKLSHWNDLRPEKRKEIGLPVRLEFLIEQLISEIENREVIDKDEKELKASSGENKIHKIDCTSIHPEGVTPKVSTAEAILEQRLESCLQKEMKVSEIRKRKERKAEQGVKQKNIPTTRQQVTTTETEDPQEPNEEKERKEQSEQVKDQAQPQDPEEEEVETKQEAETEGEREEQEQTREGEDDGRSGGDEHEEVEEDDGGSGGDGHEEVEEEDGGSGGDQHDWNTRQLFSFLDFGQLEHEPPVDSSLISHEEQTESSWNAQLFSFLDFEQSSVEAPRKEERMVELLEEELVDLELDGRSKKGVKAKIGGKWHELDFDEPVSTFVQKIGEDALLLSDEGNVLDTSVPNLFSVIPGYKIKLPNTRQTFVLKPLWEPSAIDRWLTSLGLASKCNLFYKFGVDDFFSIPFINKNALLGMSILEGSVCFSKILKAVEQVRNSSIFSFLALWIEFLGFPQYSQVFMKEKISLHTLRMIDEKSFNKMGIDEESLQKICTEVEKYKLFSSIEETFIWLRMNGFEKYAFHFVRYNIPFYALPFVNFFIIDGMGFSSEDQILLKALQDLKTSPAYLVKGMAFWLRDLDMEGYNLNLAREECFELEEVIKLEDSAVDKLVKSSLNIKLKEALKELKLFQYYHTATAALLEELGIDKYTEIFAFNGIAVDVLPLLTEPTLIQMGVTDPSIRAKILKAVKKIQGFIPFEVPSWYAELEPHESVIAQPNHIHEIIGINPCQNTARMRVRKNNTAKSKRRRRRRNSNNNH